MQHQNLRLCESRFVSKNSSPTEFCYLKIEEARNGDFQEKKILKRIHIRMDE
jgi:hypothetical protein